MSKRGEELASLPVPDELLAEILLRLPTPADLVRASAACVSFHRLAAHRSFVRRFRKRHAPPLLGFLTPYQSVNRVDGSRFAHPAVAPYPSAAAASALDLAADFSFSFLPSPRPAFCWLIRDIRDGRVLLDRSWRQQTRDSREIVVCDPLHRRYVLLPPIPAVSPDAWRKQQYFLAPSGDDDEEGSATNETSFRVIWMAQWDANLLAFVFSSGTAQWRAVPPQSCSDLFAGLFTWTRMPLSSSRQYASGSFYWMSDSNAKMLVLDTRRMEFSIAEPAPGAKYRDIAIVDAGEGNTGMFWLDQAFKLSYSIRRNSGGNSSQWGSERTISVGFRFNCEFLAPVSVRKIIARARLLRDGHQNIQA